MTTYQPIDIRGAEQYIDIPYDLRQRLPGVDDRTL